MQERLEGLDLRQAMQELYACLRLKRLSEPAGFDCVPYPGPLCVILYVRSVVTGRAAIHLAQGVDNVARVARVGRNRALNHRGRHVCEVGWLDACLLQVHGRVAGRLAAQRIEVRRKVSAAANSARDV